ncbi:ribonuclease HI [Vibrio parahaemolyticus]|uniref:ribonuclease HI n=1 Tax=Vibrio parahaemolyticus TaxID=670 RepID=UPI000C9C14AD|nr:ribonuclease HI [Vibrio parahaemolyticus]MDK9424789.1 ribonuclease HI [Vibrio parahaemolyticus]MDK9432756.1 ribonuclease HI [Vibrio parahaemolyticus]MDK9436356.1 ribonuclease HI [Vibrio parahaemolyticus]
MSYSIYVDGAAPNNQHVCMRGGIGLVVFNEDDDIVHEEGITIDRETDNAELELLALIEGLEYAEDGDVIYSDSEYCVKGFNLWLDGWKDRGWRKANKKPVKHRQLWKQVDELRSRKYVEVLKVKAHSGVRGNEIADSLAVDAARSDID